MRRPFLQPYHALILGLAACSAPTEPFAHGGYATVQGQVTDRSGAALPQVTVSIVCPSGNSRVETSTDATGRYVTNVYTPGVSPETNRVRCQFSELNRPGTGSTVDTVIAIVRPPLLAALQTIDIHETSRP
jgi:hypothetical protein